MPKPSTVLPSQHDARTRRCALFNSRAHRMALVGIFIVLGLVSGCASDTADNTVSEAASGSTVADTATPAEEVSSNGGEGGDSVDVPEGATFCSIFKGSYRPSIDRAVPDGQPGARESLEEIIRWAEVLQKLAPGEMTTQAADNVAYHVAQLERRSVSPHVPGSNELSSYGFQNCQ